jgi:hypothetical protein
MIPHVFDKRPPYVRFEEREQGINAEASEVAGRPIPRVVTLACITPHGSKDVVEKIAEEWLAQIRSKALKNEYPLEWVNLFTAQYDEFKKGNEMPREGSPVKTWPALTKEQALRLHALGYTTIEDLAECPDSELAPIGLDGRYLRDLARNWINEAKDKGINARELADAKARLADQEALINELKARLTALEAAKKPKAA